MHIIVDFNNGHTGALEMSCDRGCDIQNLVDFERVEWLEAAENNTKKTCPECGRVTIVKNQTP